MERRGLETDQSQQRGLTERRGLETDQSQAARAHGEEGFRD